MNRMRLFAITASAIGLASTAALWLWPPLPPDTPYFHWEKGEDGYALQVSHIATNPAFRTGVTMIAPRSGRLLVVGKAGTAEPGALVEVSNARTREGFRTTAGPDGAFAVTAEAQRGDTLKIISRVIRFRRPTAATLAAQPMTQAPSPELSGP